MSKVNLPLYSKVNNPTVGKENLKMKIGHTIIKNHIGIY
jgi:hypothetical protein